jgi:hypothetical protein
MNQPDPAIDALLQMREQLLTELQRVDKALGFLVAKPTQREIDCEVERILTRG